MNTLMKPFKYFSILVFLAGIGLYLSMEDYQKERVTLLLEDKLSSYLSNSE